MEYSRLKFAVATAMLATPFAASATSTISVTGASSGVCTNSADGYCYMSQAFGDTDQVDASYERIDAAGVVTGLAHRTVNFGDLGNTIGAGTNQIATSFGQITLRARTGFELSLLGFDFAQYYLFSPTVPISILDLRGNTLLAGNFSTGSGSSHSSLSINSAFGEGVVIRWGAGANVVGVDNISYDTRALVAAVPEPGVWAMLIAGFGFVGNAMRRRIALRFAPTLA